LLAAAEQIGPSTVALCEAIMRTKPHPEQGFRSCLGILRMEKTYGARRLEAACRRGRVKIGASPSIASSFLPEAIARFNKRWPEIEISLQDDFYGRDLERLTKGDVDFAIIPFDQPTEQFRFERLLRDCLRQSFPKGISWRANDT
jgi:DNA-binding transcriptional LysR family regulator